MTSVFLMSQGCSHAQTSWGSNDSPISVAAQFSESREGWGWVTHTQAYEPFTQIIVQYFWQEKQKHKHLTLCQVMSGFLLCVIAGLCTVRDIFLCGERYHMKRVQEASVVKILVINQPVKLQQSVNRSF